MVANFLGLLVTYLSFCTCGFIEWDSYEIFNHINYSLQHVEVKERSIFDSNTRLKRIIHESALAFLVRKFRLLQKYIYHKDCHCHGCYRKCN